MPNFDWFEKGVMVIFVLLLLAAALSPVWVRVVSLL